jgi:hypothetical protein|tara:strand:+ start:554 stop:1057 length:504 start_codon:yes stop_codon:yes gene_type:complete
METKTYLIKHEYNYEDKKIDNISGSTITVQFKIMDSLAVLEIVGTLKGQTHEEIKHIIICHKDQDLLVLNTKDDQIDNQGQEFDKDRIRFELTHEEKKIDHGQFDEELYLNPKVIFNTKHLIRDTFSTTVLNELQELIIDVLANREDSQKEVKQIDLEDLINEKVGS